MLSQSLLCSILPITLLTNELRPLDAAFLVSLQHVAASQQLGTIATGELLPPMDIHMLPQSVGCHEHQMTYGTLSVLPLPLPGTT